MGYKLLFIISFNLTFIADKSYEGRGDIVTIFQSHKLVIIQVTWARKGQQMRERTRDSFLTAGPGLA